MKKFLGTFLLFAIFGFFMVLSIIIAVAMAYGVISFLSLDLDKWGKIIAFIIWLCFSMPLASAALDIVSDRL